MNDDKEAIEMFEQLKSYVDTYLETSEKEWKNLTPDTFSYLLGIKMIIRDFEKKRGQARIGVIDGEDVE